MAFGAGGHQYGFAAAISIYIFILVAFVSYLGSWFRQVGWRHLVGIIALFFAIFPILFLVSAAFNPECTLSSAKLIPTGASFNNFKNLFANYPFWRWTVTAC